MKFEFFVLIPGGGKTFYGAAINLKLLLEKEQVKVSLCLWVFFYFVNSESGAMKKLGRIKNPKVPDGCLEVSGRSWLPEVPGSNAAVSNSLSDSKINLWKELAITGMP